MYSFNTNFHPKHCSHPFWLCIRAVKEVPPLFPVYAFAVKQQEWPAFYVTCVSPKTLSILYTVPNITSFEVKVAVLSKCDDNLKKTTGLL